jgi:ferritin-like metal-binding protein YciE
MTTQTNINSTEHDERHTVATYLSDLLALERHIAAPLDAQIDSDEHQAMPEAAQIFRTIKANTDRHIATLEARLEALGGHPGSAVKSAWSQLLGSGAAALNTARKTKVSKSLRDDYTVLGLASISYTMFHATSLGLGDSVSAQIAKQALDDIAPVIVKISQTIPVVVLAELQADGENVRITAAELTQEASRESWSGSNTSTGA